MRAVVLIYIRVASFVVVFACCETCVGGLNRMVVDECIACRIVVRFRACVLWLSYETQDVRLEKPVVESFFALNQGRTQNVLWVCCQNTQRGTLRKIFGLQAIFALVVRGTRVV